MENTASSLHSCSPCPSSLIHEIQSQITSDSTKINELLLQLQQLKKLKSLLHRCDNMLEQRQIFVLNHYDPKYDYNEQFQPYHAHGFDIGDRLMQLQVQCRGNWIANFLDKADVEVYALFGGNRVKVVREYNGVVSFVREFPNQISNDASQTVSKSIQEFYQHNKYVTVQFPQNKFMHQFGSSIVKINVTEPCRILVQVQCHNQNENQSNISRILILKKHHQSCQLLQSQYQPDNLTLTLTLSPCQYWLIPFPNSSMTIYTTSRALPQVEQVPFQYRTSIKQLNLLLQAFPRKNAECMQSGYTRDCDYQAGIVVEGYWNGFGCEIGFQDIQEEKTREEDKKLMFKELYSKRFRNYRLKPGQILVQFFQVTKKPAVLYQPKKKYDICYLRVRADKKVDLQVETIHSILK